MHVNAKEWDAMTATWRGAHAQQWDQAEFEMFFLVYYDAIYRHLFRVVGCRQEAEDLAQEVFLRLYQQRFADGRAHNVRAWLYRVATNLAYNALRSEKRQERRTEIVASLTLADGAGEDPEQSMARDDQRRLVRRVLGTLRPRTSRLLLLRYAGLSYAELADVLDVAPRSVGTLLARAEKAFAKAYERAGRVASEGNKDEM